MLDIDQNEQSTDLSDKIAPVANKGFVDSLVGFPLFGETLRPFSPSRVIAAQSMGLMYPYIGEGGAEQLERTGLYAGAVRDVAIWCWLCGLEDEDQLDPKLTPAQRRTIWTPDKAFMKPQEASQQAMKWAIERNVHLQTSPEFDEAYKVFMSFQAGMSASDFILKAGKSDGPKQEDDPDAPKA